jgi:hypothetical protein
MFASIMAGTGFMLLDAELLKFMAAGVSFLIACTAALFMLINPGNR